MLPHFFKTIATKRFGSQWLLKSRVLFSTASKSSDNDPNTATTTTTRTHFGFENVAIHEKEGRVRQVFENVADSYDVMNDVMSGGLHRYWKDVLLDKSQVQHMAQIVRALPSSSSLNILDVAGGTGDIAFRFVNAANCYERSKSSGIDNINITVCDINNEMLRVGEDRARKLYGHDMIDTTKSLTFQQGNAQDLYQFKDNTFDLYTIAFGLRNVTNIPLALQEAHRVLKPGGRFMCLEFSRVPNDTIRQFYDLYSFHVIPKMGEVIANDAPSYQYLVESIRKFYTQDELLQELQKANFTDCTYTNLTQGIVAIHEGYKPVVK